MCATASRTLGNRRAHLPAQRIPKIDPADIEDRTFVADANRSIVGYAPPRYIMRFLLGR